MRNILGLAVCLLAASTVAVAQETPANPAWGRVLAERNRCIECHGADGYAVAADTPHLAGQSEPYMVRQLIHYRNGTRAHPFMELFAGTLSDNDMADIAAFFACQGERHRGSDRCRRER